LLCILSVNKNWDFTWKGRTWLFWEFNNIIIYLYYLSARWIKRQLNNIIELYYERVRIIILTFLVCLHIIIYCADGPSYNSIIKQIKLYGKFGHTGTAAEQYNLFGIIKHPKKYINTCYHIIYTHSKRVPQTGRYELKSLFIRVKWLLKYYY